MTGLPDAIVAAQGALIQECTETGAWRVGCDGGPAATAMVAVCLRFMGALAEPGAAREIGAGQRIGAYLRACQRPDGGFPASPAADRSDLATTALCLAGLHATDAPAEAIDRARAFVRANGDLEAILQQARGGDLGALALGLVQQIPAHRLPQPPLPFDLAPGIIERWMEGRFAFIVPFRAIMSDVLVDHLVRRDAASGQSAGLFGQVLAAGAGAGRELAGGMRGGQSGLLRAVAEGTLGLAGSVYRGARSVLAGVGRRVPGTQRWRCMTYLRRFQNRDGSYLYGDSMHTALALAALHALGVPHTDPRVAGGLRWLRTQAVNDEPRGHRRYDVFSTDVWPTTFAMRALLASGVPATDPVITRAANWLISIQREGSWAFQANNSTTPDSDDTAVALSALALVREDLLRTRAQGAPVSGYLLDRCQTAIASARRWLIGFQNAVGGWPSYQHGLPGKPRGPIMTRVPVPPDGARAWLDLALHPPPELGDPATEDLTGRVLHALGKAGARADDPAVARAIAFLQAQQADNGGWWGRWVVNFLAGTAWVLRGLAAVEAGRPEWVRRGLGFLIAHQNDDGGWGETAESYRDPGLAGKGPSNPCLTGLVLCALIEMGEASAAVQEGIAYLLRHFASAGWRVGDDALLHALFPPNLFYTLPLSNLHMPLEALGLHGGPALREDVRLRGVPDSGRSAHIDALDKLGDEPADRLIRELDEAGQIDLVNHVLGPLSANADLPPPGAVPPNVRAFLEATDDLPPWVEKDKIAMAQRLFVRCGWGVGTVLFCSSLPQCYCFPQGARVLLSTGGFEANARKRVMETAQFVFDVASPRGLEPRGRGIRTTQKVRLIHAGIRRLIEKHGGWPAGGPVPLSQLQMLGTLMTFSAVVTDGLRGLGFRVSAEEAEAWFHLWRAVGSILGIPLAILPADLDAGQAVFDQMRAQHWGPSREGRELMRVTLDAAHELTPAREFDHLAEALVRHLAGDHCADLLEVPRTDWNALLSAAGRAERLRDLVVGDALLDSPPAVLFQRIAFLFMLALAAQEREGKRVPFEIPTSLTEAWSADVRTRFRT